MDALNYKGLIAQQHQGVLEVFPSFLEQQRPRRILEIGTADGGFTLFLKDSLDRCGLTDCILRSYDISERGSYAILRSCGIEVRVENVFVSDPQDLSPLDGVRSFIGEDGVTVVLCDGGNKPQEFAILSDFLKPGDFILAHDYVRSRQVFEESFRGRIWDWCEVEEKDLEEASRRNGLADYLPELFAGVVWACKRKGR